MIPYSYEIIKVDPQARVMEVVYSSPGRQTMHISARLPFVGESLTDIIDTFSPVAYWREQESEVVVPQLGSGTGGRPEPEPEPVTIQTVKRDKLAEIADWRFRRETSGVNLNGARILTDRESQATIGGAFSSLQAGLVTSIDWKAANGVWITLGLAEMTAIAQAVAAHVQQSFTLEKQYAQMVEQAQTIGEVEAITLPTL